MTPLLRWNLRIREFIILFLDISRGLSVKPLPLFVFGGMKKGDWDVGIAMDIIKLSGKLDVVILVAGDGDYVPLVEYLKNNGCQVVNSKRRGDFRCRVRT